MNKSLATLLAAAAAATFSAGAFAQDTTRTVEQTTTTGPSTIYPDGTQTKTVTTTTDTITLPKDPGLTKDEARDQKIQSKADYKARKKIADANLDLNKADCETSADGAVARACKGSAKAQAKKDKADAKVIHSQEVQDIKDNTQQ
jgi:hypothetical protein